MYPVANPRIGQRVTVFNHRIGTVVRQAPYEEWVIQFDGHPGIMGVFNRNQFGALIPGNDDGYFDGPPGYIAAT